MEPFHPLIILSSRHLPPFLFLFPLLLSLLPRESVPRHTNLASSSRLRSLHSISSLCLFPSLCPPTPLSQPPLFAFALIFHSCCSKTSRHALLKPVVFSLFFFFLPTSYSPLSSPQSRPTHPSCSDFPPPPPLVLSIEAEQAKGGGGELDKPAENCPSKGNVYVREGRCSHQRIHTQTQRHLAPASVHPLTLFLPVLLPGCTDGS